MLIGSHVSAAGGIWKAPENAASIGCEAFQFFSRPPQGGNVGKLTDEVIKKFRDACEKHSFDTYVIHAPYVINLASVVPRIRDGSIRIIREELERGAQLGARAVMFHPGSAKDVDIKTGIKMVAEGINKILDGYKGSTQLLIEVSAGSGNIIGAKFDEVAAILKHLKNNDVGVCFDTAHAFAAGYDLRTKKTVMETFSRFDEEIGLERMVMSHCNDSKVELGAKKDRHDHIGEGHIGIKGFEEMLRDKRLSHLFWILETPISDQEKDIKIMKKLRKKING